MSDKNLSLVQTSSFSQLSTINQNQETQISLSEIERLAVHFGESGLFGIGKQAQSQCIVKMLAGKELGIAPFTAIKEIYVIAGKLVLSSHLMAILIKKHPSYDYKIKEHTDQTCAIEFFENGISQGVSIFTMDDAKKAGLLTDQKLYNKYTKNMLYARALSNGAKWYCPLVFGGGVYAPDEIPQIETDQGFIDIPKEENLELKKDFISSIEKLESAIAEIPNTIDYCFTVSTTDLTLDTLKSLLEDRSKLLRDLLVARLTSKTNSKEKLEQMNVVDLYSLFKQQTVSK